MKCPRCGREINNLYNRQRGWQIYRMDRNGKYEIQFDFDEVDESNFACPECDETLFETEKEAIDFLNEGGVNND